VEQKTTPLGVTNLFEGQNVEILFFFQSHYLHFCVTKKKTKMEAGTIGVPFSFLQKVLEKKTSKVLKKKEFFIFFLEPF